MASSTLLLPFIAAMALVTDAHGVKVQMRTDVKDIQVVADGSFSASPDKVIAAMTDYEHARDWQKQLSESKVLRRDAHSVDVYQRIKMPIIADRDYVLHVTWGDDDKGAWMKFKAVDGVPGTPECKKCVRMPIHEGSWRLDKGANGTQAHYEVHMDLGGSLPESMARKNVAKSIPDFFEGLRSRTK
ncbi:MAG: START domain-containing protein [Polyangia bacterium]